MDDFGNGRVFFEDLDIGFLARIFGFERMCRVPDSSQAFQVEGVHVRPIRKEVRVVPSELFDVLESKDSLTV
jgi:hypothetical protein